MQNGFSNTRGTYRSTCQVYLAEAYFITFFGVVQGLMEANCTEYWANCLLQGIIFVTKQTRHLVQGIRCAGVRCSLEEERLMPTLVGYAYVRTDPSTSI